MLKRQKRVSADTRILMALFNVKFTITINISTFIGMFQEMLKVRHRNFSELIDPLLPTMILYDHQ